MKKLETFRPGTTVRVCGGRVGTVVDVIDNTATPYRVDFGDGTSCWYRSYNLSAVSA